MDPARPSEIAATIAEQIARLGPMRFDRFMELALYAPGGYYDEPPIGAGPAGDFVTSPHVHPVFAQLVAEAVAGMHEAMGRPEPVDLIEAGAGDGTLLRALMPELAHSPMRLVAVERSPGARRALGAIDGVSVHETMPPPGAPTVIVAHELLDNLPFRRIRATDDGPREVHVGFEGDRFVEVLVPADDDLEAPAHDGESVVPTGAAAFVTEALAGPGPRALLAIDYGSDQGAGGPAHGYASHRVVEDLLAAPGATDITAGVDFGFLARAVNAQGLQAFPTVSQHDALGALGLEDWLHTQLERQQDELNSGRGADAVRTWGGRSRAVMLAYHAGLGRFRWFVATTPGVDEPAWLTAARERRSAAEA
jgi:NADH dehydrogenase [ubiquinone] 1 alpha subcomplex assembly factor 7